MQPGPMNEAAGAGTPAGAAVERLRWAAARAWGGEQAAVEALLGPAGAAFDPELASLASGACRAALKPCASAAEAQLLAEACRGLGFAARALTGDEGPAVAVAVDEGTVGELSHWVETRTAETRRRVVEAIGKLLGYPTCCIAAYASQPTRGPWAEDVRATFRRAPKAALAPLLNRLARVRLTPHHPCAPNCAASVSRAEELLVHLRKAAPDAGGRLLDVLQRSMLLWGAGRVELDGDWIGDAFELERATPLDETDVEPSVWAAADRLVFAPSSVTVVDRDGTRRLMPDRAPLLVQPGAPLALPAVLAFLGAAVVEEHPLPGLPWLGLAVGAAEQGFTLTEARHASDRLELVFTRGGRAVTSWLAPAQEGRPAFKKSALLSFGYVGQRLEADEMALLETVWKRADASRAQALASIDAFRAARLALEEEPRNSRPTRWLGEGPPPPPRLKVLGAKDVDRFFHVDYEWGETNGGSTSRVGIIYRCNQWCGFCNLSDMDVKLPVEKVKAAIDGARQRGSREIILTGGEPTLSPHVVEYVAYAKSKGFSDIILQTNAVRLERSDLAARLRAAGLTKAQVSLHGPDAAVSDRLTQAPGTHAKTVQGVTRLLDLGVVVLINHLIFRENHRLLVDFVEFAKARWGDRSQLLVLQFRSPKNEFNTDEDARAHTPRYADYTRLLLEAIERARSYGFATSHVLDPVGVPSLCVLGDHGVDVDRLVARDDHPAHHAWESDWFTRIDACKTCGVAAVCQGVRKDYVQLHGESEFHPLPVLPSMARRQKR